MYQQAKTSLSPRETTVLHLIAWGYTNKAIAMQLVLSVKTIEAHKANGMRKLRVGTRAELMRWAVDSGWLLRDAAPINGVPYAKLSADGGLDEVKT